MDSDLPVAYFNPVKVLPKPKQVRFTQLVKSSGKPYAAALWSNPNKDPKFKNAIAEERIVTVRNVNVGSRKERGIVGFLPGPHSTYLIFPKPIPFAEGTSVIGLNFDELAEAPVKDPVKIKTAAPKIKN